VTYRARGLSVAELNTALPASFWVTSMRYPCRDKGPYLWAFLSYFSLPKAASAALVKTATDCWSFKTYNDLVRKTGHSSTNTLPSKIIKATGIKQRPYNELWHLILQYN